MSRGCVADEPGLRRLTLDLGDLANGLIAGASVAVNVNALTATAITETLPPLTCRETVARTNLGGVNRR
jgi:riboflavin synthase alpha subunit